MSFDLTLQNISIAYQERVLCKNIYLQLKAGTCTCLLGSSGVGKSSLLHLIAEKACHVNHAFLSLRMTGTLVTSDHHSLENRVMLMTQQDNLLPWLNILDNVILGYRLRDQITEAVKDRAKKLLAQVGLLENDWHKKPSALSGGMRQRAVLVRTVIEDKPLWLLDEPFSALDAITRYKMQNLLASLWKEKTILLVTHDPLEALRLADEIYVMRGSPAVLEKIPIHDLDLLKPRELVPELLAKQANILEMLSL